MTKVKIVLGISLAVIVAIVVYQFVSGGESRPKKRQFVSREEIEIVAKTIIDELDVEVKEAVPSQLQSNVDELTLTDKDEGELLALLDNNTPNANDLGSSLLGTSVSLPGINTKALNSSFEKQRKIQLAAVNSLQKKFQDLEKQILLHNQGKVKISSFKIIAVKATLAKTKVELTKAKSSLNVLIAKIATDNKKQNDAAKAKAEAESKAKEAAKKAADSARAAAAAKANAIEEATAKAEATERKRADDEARAKAKAAADARDRGSPTEAAVAEKSAREAKIVADKKNEEFNQKRDKEAQALKDKVKKVVSDSKEVDEEERKEKENKEKEKKKEDELMEVEKEKERKKESMLKKEKEAKGEQEKAKKEADVAEKKASENKARDQKLTEVAKAELNLAKAQASKLTGEKKEQAEEQIKSRLKKIQEDEKERNNIQKELDNESKSLRKKSDDLEKKNTENKEIEEKEKEDLDDKSRKEIVRIGGIGDQVFEREGMMKLSFAKLESIRKIALKQSLNSIVSSVTHVMSIKKFMDIGENAGLSFVKIGPLERIDYSRFEIKILGAMLKYLKLSKDTNANLINVIEDAIQKKKTTKETEEEALNAHKKETIKEIIRIGGIGQNIFDGKTQFGLPLETLIKVLNYAKTRSMEFFVTELIGVITMKLLVEIQEDLEMDFMRVRFGDIDFDEFDHDQLSRILTAMRFVPKYHFLFEFVSDIKKIRDLKERKNTQVAFLERLVEITGLSEEELQSGPKSLMELPDDKLVEVIEMFKELGMTEAVFEVERLKMQKRLIEIGKGAGIDFTKVQLLNIDLEKLDVLTLAKLEDFVLAHPNPNPKFIELSEEMKSIRERRSVKALESENKEREEAKFKQEQELSEAEDARLARENLDKEERRKRLDEEKRQIDMEIKEEQERADLERTELLAKQARERSELEKENDKRERGSFVNGDESLEEIKQQNMKSVMALEQLQEAQLDLLDTEIDIDISNLEESRALAEEERLDSQHEEQEAAVTVVTPEKPRSSKAGRVKVQTNKNEDGSSVVKLNVPSDMSPGENDDISLVVSKEGSDTIERYHEVFKKIKRDMSLDNVSLEEKEIIASAGEEFKKIKDDYVRQRGSKISKRTTDLAENV